MKTNSSLLCVILGHLLYFSRATNYKTSIQNKPVLREESTKYSISQQPTLLMHLMHSFYLAYPGALVNCSKGSLYAKLRFD